MILGFLALGQILQLRDVLHGLREKLKTGWLWGTLLFGNSDADGKACWKEAYFIEWS